jgi:hypothetical protein
MTLFVLTKIFLGRSFGPIWIDIPQSHFRGVVRNGRFAGASDHLFYLSGFHFYSYQDNSNIMSSQSLHEYFSCAPS